MPVVDAVAPDPVNPIGLALAGAWRSSGGQPVGSNPKLQEEVNSKISPPRVCMFALPARDPPHAAQATVQALNNKSDGFFDHLLPHTRIEVRPCPLMCLASSLSTRPAHARVLGAAAAGL